jgi:hypothetical protein
MQIAQKRKGAVKTGLTILLVCAVMVVIVLLLSSTDQMTQSEQTRALSRTLHNAAISCYAIEGRYPDTLEKMVRDYGIVLDESKYLIHYDVFADNLMPIIMVDLKGEN